MNHRFHAALLTLALLAASPAQAHDPALHAKDAAEKMKGPECAKLDHGKMKANDPVAQALMAKCGMSHDTHDAHGEPAKPVDAAVTPAPSKPASHGGHQP